MRSASNSKIYGSHFPEYSEHTGHADILSLKSYGYGYLGSGAVVFNGLGGGPVQCFIKLQNNAADVECKQQ